MALTPKEERQLLMDLVSGRITKAQYDEIRYNQRIRDLRTSAGAPPNPLTEAEKALFTRAASNMNTTPTPVTSQPEEELTPGGRPLFPGTQLTPNPVPLAAQNTAYGRVRQMLEAQVNKQKKAAGHAPVNTTVPKPNLYDSLKVALKLLGR